MRSANGHPMVIAVVLSMLAFFGPFSMNLYLPVLPELTEQLGTTAALAQLTMTACLVGLAGGQLVIGPLSDRYGRRKPLLLGTVAYVVASLACAWAPNITVLLVARLLQGLAASAGVVIALAAGRDVYEGAKLVAYYGRFTMLSGLAGAVSPVIGGVLASFIDWRGSFVALALLGGVVLAATFFGLPETLPAVRESLPTEVRGRRDAESPSFLSLLSNRTFLKVLLVIGLVNMANFGYVSASTFVYQSSYGVSPQTYSLLMALFSGSYMLFGWLAGRVAIWRSTQWALVASVVLGLTGGAGILGSAMLGLPLATMVVAMFVLAAAASGATTAATAIGMEANPEAAGAASSLLGVVRYGSGAIAAPLVGIAGAQGAGLSLGVLSVAVMTVSLLIGWRIRVAARR
ncbi:MAG: multidrug effflux MFS transporter [Ancrocorticia sp.]